MSSSEASKRLAESSPWKKPQALERLLRVEADEVEIAAQPAVLESVVEEKDVRTELLEDLAPHDRAVRSDGDGETRNRPRELERLIAAILGRGVDLPSIRSEHERRP
jgi:hypothetical protein